MKAWGFDRDGCHVGRRYVRYETLCREYQCGHTRDGRFCRGRPVVDYDEPGGWVARCGVCGASDFIHVDERARQKNKVIDLLDHMPPQVAKSYLKRRQQNAGNWTDQ